MGMGHGSKSRDLVGRVRSTLCRPPRRPVLAVSACYSGGAFRAGVVTLGGLNNRISFAPHSPMSRPLTRAQALQNRAFLKLLRKTGNVRLAARELGLKYGTMQHRRRVQPAFAAQVEAALVFAQARFAKRSGPSTIRSTADGSPPHR